MTQILDAAEDGDTTGLLVEKRDVFVMDVHEQGSRRDLASARHPYKFGHANTASGDRQCFFLWAKVKNYLQQIQHLKDNLV